MSRKFNLIPNDMLKSLLSLVDDSDALSKTRVQLDSLLENRKLDNSTKNALYNQELHRYLKQRKEILDKPLRVEVTNQGALRPSTPPSTIPSNLPSSPSTTLHTVPTMSPPPSPTPSAANAQLPRTPPKTTPVRVKKSEKRAEKLVEKIEKDKRAKVLTPKGKVLYLKNYINKNRMTVGVNKQGNIVNNGVVVKGSDFEKSLVNMVTGDPTRQPVGTNVLKKSLLAHSPTRNVLLYGNAQKQEGSGFSKFVFKPAIWNY